jgi:seryl-tRNA(Sec) selenium transferase
MERPEGRSSKTVQSTEDWEVVMAMPTRELRAYLRTLPPKRAEEIRLARLRAARRAYRERHLSDEKRRQASWYRRKMDELRKHPAELARFRAKDAERKRIERAAKREQAASSSGRR